MKRLIYTIVIACVATLLAMPVQAQRHRKTARKPRVAAKKPAGNSELFNSMLPATAKVMFIDSIVVPKEQFLNHLNIGQELGTISIKSNDFPGTMMPLTVYENELGDRRIFASGDTTATSLYSQTLLGNKWSEPSKLSEIDNETYQLQDFPFLMSDGVTLFFSANGKNSLGKRDIFMTTFDSEKGTYYEPQNYGLPFNSSANDYLLAIDDVDSLGWLVSDRYQSKDSVCIYTFVPTQPRLDFQSDDISQTELEGYAKLKSIKDTWKFGNRWGAIQRRDNMLARMRQQKPSGNQELFVVNDRRVIRSAAELNTAEGKRLFAQLQEVKAMMEQSENHLNTLRSKYATDRSTSLSERILKEEANLSQQREDVKMLSKKIRQVEASNN